MIAVVSHTLLLLSKTGLNIPCINVMDDLMYSIATCVSGSDGLFVSPCTSAAAVSHDRHIRAYTDIAIFVVQMGHSGHSNRIRLYRRGWMERDTYPLSCDERFATRQDTDGVNHGNSGLPDHHHCDLLLEIARSG